MENLRKENEMLRDKIKKMVWHDYCCICKLSMCPHRDSNECSKCKRNVCYWCSQDEENFVRKYELCNLCIEKMNTCSWCEEYTSLPSHGVKCIGCDKTKNITLCCKNCEEDFNNDIKDGFVCIDC